MTMVQFLKSKGFKRNSDMEYVVKNSLGENVYLTDLLEDFLEIRKFK